MVTSDGRSVFNCHWKLVTVTFSIDLVRFRRHFHRRHPLGPIDDLHQTHVLFFDIGRLGISTVSPRCVSFFSSWA